MKKPKAQAGMLPARVPRGRAGGRVDFSGQDSGYPSSSPVAEARTNKDAKPKPAFVPTIDDNSRKAQSTVFSADNDRLHASRGRSF